MEIMVGAHTKHKLEEAKFFLDSLKDNFGKAKKFDFFLSAYLTSARAVSWIMKAEFGGSVGYQDWRKEVETDEEKKLFKKITDIRNNIEKVAPITTSPEYKITLSESDMVRLKGYVAVSLNGPTDACDVEFRSPSGERVVCRAIEVSVKRRLEEFPADHVLEVCERYYAALSRIVALCEARFLNHKRHIMKTISIDWVGYRPSER